MTTLLLFILGIALITLLARYNESNKLFWTLLTCFTLGVVGAKIVHDISSKEKSSNKVMAVQPTQELAVTSSTFMYLLADDLLPTPTKATSNPVSQANVPAMYNDATLSDVPGVTEELYIHVFPNPPNNVGIVDDS